MEFKLTKSQIEIQKAAKDFAKSEFDKELAAEMDKEAVFPQKICKKAAELGFTSIHFEEEYLGGGLGFLENVLMAEELCRKDSTLGSALMLSSYGADILNDFGSKELKSHFLTDLAEGKKLSGGSIAGSEPNGQLKGNDLEAQQENNNWVINGRIRNVVNGELSWFYPVLCRTDPTASLEKSYSMILVEKDREGVEVSDTGPKLGLRMTTMADLKLENVHVPQENIVGKVGDGLKQMVSFTNKSRVLLAGLALGTGQGVLERTVDYVKQREQFRKKLTEFQITRHKLAQMAIKIEQARTLTYQAAWQMDQKKQDISLAAMAKLAATQAALDCAHEAIQLHGGYGFSTEYEVERFCRDAKSLHLLGGNPGTLNEDIASTVIGKIK